MVGPAFDGLGSSLTAADGVLATDEIQCAIDCLDGDREGEHLLPPGWKAYDEPPMISGGTLVFLPEQPPKGGEAVKGMPRIRYQLTAGVELPFTASSLTVRGDGAVLRLIPGGSGDRALFSRTVPRSATLAVLHYVSINESHLALLDLASGRRTPIDPPGDGPCAFGNAAFSADSQTVFFTCDADAEFVFERLADEVDIDDFDAVVASDFVKDLIFRGQQTLALDGGKLVQFVVD